MLTASDNLRVISRRCWIDQPSTHQPLHAFHGKNVIAVTVNKETTLYFIDGAVESMCIGDLGGLRNGWLNMKKECIMTAIFFRAYIDGETIHESNKPEDCLEKLREFFKAGNTCVMYGVEEWDESYTDEDGNHWSEWYDEDGNDASEIIDSANTDNIMGENKR